LSKDRIPLPGCGTVSHDFFLSQKIPLLVRSPFFSKSYFCEGPLFGCFNLTPRPALRGHSFPLSLFPLVRLFVLMFAAALLPSPLPKALPQQLPPLQTPSVFMRPLERAVDPWDFANRSRLFFLRAIRDFFLASTLILSSRSERKLIVSSDPFPIRILFLRPARRHIPG